MKTPHNHQASSELSPKPAWNVKMLYDGACPVCSREVQYLKRRAERRQARVAFEDIDAPHFDPRRYGVSLRQLHRRIHAVLPDGTLIHDLEVFRRVYGELGLGWALAWTRLPLVRHFANLGYGIFSRLRPLLQRPGPCHKNGCDLDRVEGTNE